MPQNYAKAGWFRRAAEQGNAAQKTISRCIESPLNLTLKTMTTLAQLL